MRYSLELHQSDGTTLNTKSKVSTPEKMRAKALLHWNQPKTRIDMIWLVDEEGKREQLCGQVKRAVSPPSDAHAAAAPGASEATIVLPGWFNFQSAYPGGAVEQRRLKDCETLWPALEKGWLSTRELSRQIGWSRRRVRAVIGSMRVAVEHERRKGEHGAEEDRWRLKS